MKLEVFSAHHFAQKPLELCMDPEGGVPSPLSGDELGRKRIGKRSAKERESPDILNEDTRLPVPEERVGAKFSSSFAIDSILSTPFIRREDSHVEAETHAPRIYWSPGAHLLPYTLSYPAQHTYVSEGAYSGTEPGRDVLTYLQQTAPGMVAPEAGLHVLNMSYKARIWPTVLQAVSCSCPGEAALRGPETDPRLVSGGSTDETHSCKISK
ncbi:hypothetical protein FQN60_012743 [Etheostoma spectabile]|uniref:Uncharacterized protein n=1 Tax=Etheostoma spectabile TaxID=54343 RepID=A0A5J5D3U4_9PERO|nr:hypothetical protein FQN60_012743 [Etheostoma spectabile]